MSKTDKMNPDLWKKEKTILVKLKHPNIIKLIETCEDSQCFYIVTQLCDGGELFDRVVDKKNPITEKRAAQLVKTMLDAIDYCRKQNFVHRDLKPENFVFKTKAQDSEMVLIDFGCAKVVERTQEYTDLVGTPYYLAPESAAGHKYTRTGEVLMSSDIWSIGVIAYVLMTGRPPFNGHSNTEIFANIIKKPLKFPANVKLSKPFIKYVKKMLKKSPKQRIKMAEALKDPWVTGEKASNTNVISSDVIKVLKQFNNQSKLKKAITRTLASHMGKEPMAKIKGHFKTLDADGNGQLDAVELSMLLMDMGISKGAAQKQAADMIKSSDVDNSGTIGFDEFAAIWQRKLLTVNDSYIHAVFTVLDENGDGEIDKDELMKVLNEKDVKTINDYISEVDANGDGKINFQEFATAMKETEVGKDGGLGKDGPGVDVKADDIPDVGDVDLDNVVED